MAKNSTVLKKDLFATYDLSVDTLTIGSNERKLITLNKKESKRLFLVLYYSLNDNFVKNPPAFL